MRSRNLLVAAAAAVVGALVSGAVVAAMRRMSEPGDVAPLHAGEAFPSMTGNLLTGERFTVPENLLGKVSVLIGGWDYAARFEVEAWANALLAAYGERPDLAIREVPFIDNVGPVMRRVIDTAMTRDTPPETHSRVLTIYGDLRWLRKRLAVTDPRQAYVYVIGRTGRLAWQTAGPPTPEQLAILREILADHGINVWMSAEHIHPMPTGNGHAHRA